MDQLAFEGLFENSRSASGHARWMRLDDIYIKCKRQLRATNGWRFGPDRVHEVISDAVHRLMEHRSIEGTNYCDMGCGKYHPIGNSAIMYLNGATQAVALDIQTPDSSRAAEALADLLCDCLANADRWHLSGSARNQYYERIRQFNLQALQSGDLAGGIATTPIRHIVTDIHSSNVELGQTDLMSSRAVLEHFQDLPLATQRLFTMMRPGGFAFHHIDIVDHRAYSNPKKYHYWSFLTEPDDWTDGLVNRLRPTEIKSCFEGAGFEVLQFDARMGTPPHDLVSKLTPKFRQMSPEDINATGVDIIVQRPEATSA